MPSYISEGSYHRGSVAKGHDKRKHVRDHLLAERDRQPEKGTAPQIERHTPAHTASEVDVRIPEKAAAADCSVRQYIKRDLLDVVVPVIEKDSAVIYQKGKDRCQIQQRSSREQQYILKYVRTFSSQDSVLLLACCPCSLFSLNEVFHTVHSCKDKRVSVVSVIERTIDTADRRGRRSGLLRDLKIRIMSDRKSVV